MPSLDICAVDLGNTSGRVTTVRYDGERLKLEENHRFTNGAIPLNNHLKWDLVHIFRETVVGLAKAGEVASVGIDTWAIDFGLLDGDDDLVLLPHHHRDPRSQKAMDLFDTPEKQTKWYRETGIAFQPINTSLQLLSMVQDRREVLTHASSLLMIPDLIIFYLTGTKASEATEASTTQMISLSTGSWAWGIIEDIGVPRELFQEIAPPGTRMGNIRPDIRNAFAFSHDPEVVTVGSHDTASAIHATPIEDERSALISSGTWSLFGTVLQDPLVSEESMQIKYNNERATDGSIRFLKNIMGMWIVEEMLRIWEIQDGSRTAYDEIMAAVERTPPFRATFIPDRPRFYNPQNMVEEIRNFLHLTGQDDISSRGEMIRIVLEGLAFAYRQSLEQLSEITGKRFEAIHIVGGGSRNTVLNQFTANVCGLSVIAGPEEATTIGNALSQLEYHGELSSRRQRIDLVKSSCQVRGFEPHHTDRWEEQYHRYLSLFG